MSQEYLEGIKTQIHSRIKSIAEVSPENNIIRTVLREDDEGQVIQERLRKRRQSVL
jgi:uncharacterized protein YnzC (UPF0291/DUF896 family)